MVGIHRTPQSGLPGTVIGPDGARVDSGGLLNGRYHVVRDLGSGASAVVRLALDVRTGQLVAIKFLNYVANLKQRIGREILNQRLCAVHPHIVQFLEVSRVSGGFLEGL